MGLTRCYKTAVFYILFKVITTLADIWPVKIVPKMTYYVSIGTLNPTLKMKKWSSLINANRDMTWHNWPSCCRSAASPSLLAMRSLSMHSVCSVRSLASSTAWSESNLVSRSHISSTVSVFTSCLPSTTDRKSTIGKQFYTSPQFVGRPQWYVQKVGQLIPENKQNHQCCMYLPH